MITAAEPLVGHLHRGAEKLFEVRDYRQVLTLANRHDWLSAFCNELAVALAVERMTGMDVPLRAQWLRVLLCELNRLMAHMVFLTPLSPKAAVYREGVQALMEEASGGRIHFMFNRIGGLREDVPAGWTSRVAEFLSTVDIPADVDLDPLTGLGVLPLADAQQYGVTGPIGRASGVDFDLRRDDPLPAYQLLEFTPIVRTEGDAASARALSAGRGGVCP